MLMDLWLSPTASRAVRGEKLGGDPQIGQPSCWGCSQESLFLGSSRIHPTLLTTTQKVAIHRLREIRMVEVPYAD
jgi:hypothetical protein